MLVFGAVGVGIASSGQEKQQSSPKKLIEKTNECGLNGCSLDEFVWNWL